MQREKVPYDYQLSRNLALLAHPGLLLTATRSDGVTNVMTIGWGAIGFMWRSPVFVAMIRPSRYTYGFVEESGAFCVNVPTEQIRAWVGVCGTRSGRDLDKFGQYGMTVSPGRTVAAATIDACPIVYECRVVHVNDMAPASLPPEIEVASYGGSDYHRFFYGEIVSTWAAKAS